MSTVESMNSATVEDLMMRDYKIHEYRYCTAGRLPTCYADDFDLKKGHFCAK